jgi:hypothetical protein
MLGSIIIFGLVIGACYWIISPLLQEDVHQKGFKPKPKDIMQALRDKKNSAYATIRELEFDLRMGKLDEEDFQILKRQYAREAVGYMKEMDKLESPQATLSKPVDTVSEEEVEQGVAKIRNHESTERKYIYCPSCGEKAEAESRFCAACGSNLDKHRKNQLREEN